MSKYRHAKGLSPMQILIIIGIVIVSLAIIGGGAFAAYHFTQGKEEPTVAPTVATTAETTAPATIDEPATEAVNTDAEYIELAKKHITNMSIDEKIYQMLLVTPEALTGVDVATVAGDATKEAIEKYPVGGIYYSEDNLEDETQVTDMIKNSQSYAKTPMFIAIDEEGDVTAPVYSKLSTTKVEFDFSDSAQTKDTFNSASTIAKDIKKFGFNFNLAPYSNVQGTNTPEKTGEHVVQAVKGFESESVISVAKYFPVTENSEKSLDDLKKHDFVPFVSAIKDGVDAISISASTIKGIEDVPAFMSEKVVSQTLKNELKFTGVIITPNLTDTALTDTYDSTTLATKSIRAGADILFCPSSIDDYYTAIKNAFESGEITKERIDVSVTKIIALKYKYGILEETTPEISNTQSSETTAPTNAQ